MALALVVQPLASVTTTEYVPAGLPARLEVVAPVFHRYVYGAVPPETAVDTAPLLNPLHVTLVAVADA
jgi:hypothetical protein